MNVYLEVDNESVSFGQSPVAAVEVIIFQRKIASTGGAVMNYTFSRQ
jgi:hypothetical protein